MKFTNLIFTIATFFIFCGGAYAEENKSQYPVTLLTPLEFQDKKIEGVASAQDADKFLDFKVFAGIDKKGVEHTNPKDEKQKTTATTCREYLKLKKDGWLAYTTVELSKESFFKDTCNALDLISRAAPSKSSNFSNLPAQETDLQNYPREMLDLISADGPTCEGAKSFKECADVRKGKTTFENNKIKFTDGYFEAYFAPALKADLNKDGFEDLVYSYAYYITSGTFRFYGHVCLESAANKKITLIDCGLKE